MNIDNAIARAQRLMLDENWNRQVEVGAAAQAGRKIRGGGNDLAALEAQAFGYSSAPQVDYAPITEETLMSAARRARGGAYNDGGKPIQILQEQYQAPTPQNSKLPKSVLESFAQTPPLSGDDPYSTPPPSYYGAPQYQQPQQQYQQPQYSNIGGVDYGLIKRLVNEAIQESRGLLTEGVGTNMKGMRITDGSVIQFIDTKGNLYEGTLKLKKRAQK